MKKYSSFLLLFFGICMLLYACNTATPEKYFDVAVLNSNMLAGFADEGLMRQLESPSVKMVEGKDQPVAMQRSEVIDPKTRFVEDNIKKLKDLKVTADTKDMLQASLALYEYVLPVYKTDYMQLAKLYDGGASNDQIQSLAQAIHDKYFSRYTELYNKLVSIGKIYAERHSIKVNWGVYDPH